MKEGVYLSNLIDSIWAACTVSFEQMVWLVAKAVVIGAKEQFDSMKDLSYLIECDPNRGSIEVYSSSE